MTKWTSFFDKVLNYIGSALHEGWNRWPPEVPFKLKYSVILGSSVLHHLCSDHHGDDAVSLGGGLEAGLRQSKATESGKHIVWTSGVGRGKQCGGELCNKLKQVWRDSTAVKGHSSLLRQNPAISTCWKGLAAISYFFSPQGLTRNWLCCSVFLLVIDINFLKFSSLTVS